MISRSKTPTKKTKSPYKVFSNSVIHRSSSKKKQQSVPLEQKLQKNRQKICHTLDTYTILIKSSTPLRCLQHNSQISIFCQTQNKLLCSGCVLKNNNMHRLHKVQAIDQSYEKISNSIRKMQDYMVVQRQALQSTINMIMDNLDEQSKDYYKYGDLLKKKYQESHRLIQENFKIVWSNFLKMMETSQIKHETVAMQLKFLKQTYDTQSSFQKICKEKAKDEDLMLFHHCVLETLTHQKKFQGNIMHSPTRLIKCFAERELDKIIRINQQVQDNILNFLKQK